LDGYDWIQIAPGDTLYVNARGGGWGDALKREPEKITLDVRRGLVTADGAKRYGMVLASGNTVDARATEELRRKMEASRGDLELFDFGGTVEELKARCKADTTLEPPRSPVFQKWMKAGAAQAAE
tara:strand:- start:971 stop:1345 length:375 start_codon:yes stop_codon:yes gene_type:complete